MIARHETQTEPMDVWRRLSAPVDPQAIAWRQDGRPIARDGKYFARFVAYIEANTARERLDAVVPGEWNLTLELLPTVSAADDVIDAAPFAFKARLQILGVVREDVGTGKDQAGVDRCLQARRGSFRNRQRAVLVRAELGADGWRREVRQAVGGSANGLPASSGARAGGSCRRRRRARIRDAAVHARVDRERRSSLPQVRRAHVGQSYRQAQPEGTGLQVPGPWLRRCHLAAAYRRRAGTGRKWRRSRSGRCTGDRRADPLLTGAPKRKPPLRTFRGAAVFSRGLPIAERRQSPGPSRSTGATSAVP